MTVAGEERRSSLEPEFFPPEIENLFFLCHPKEFIKTLTLVFFVIEKHVFQRSIHLRQPKGRQRRVVNRLRQVPSPKGALPSVNRHEGGSLEV